MIRLEQKVFLVFYVLHLLLLEKEFLVDSLHGVHLSHLAVRDEENFSKAALVDHFDDLEIVKVYFLAIYAGFSYQTLTHALVFGVIFLVQVLCSVILLHIRHLYNYEVIEELVLKPIDPLISDFRHAQMAATLIVLRLGLSPIK